MAGRSRSTITTVEPIMTASPGRIATRSPGLMAASRTRVPLALCASSMARTGAGRLSAGSMYIRACSRDASGSSTRTVHFEDRPSVTTPETGQRPRHERLRRHHQQVKPIGLRPSANRGARIGNRGLGYQVFPRLVDAKVPPSGESSKKVGARGRRRGPSGTDGDRRKTRRKTGRRFADPLGSNEDPC